MVYTTIQLALIVHREKAPLRRGFFFVFPDCYAESGCSSVILLCDNQDPLLARGGLSVAPMCILEGMKKTTIFLSTLATLRLTRLITSDALSEWLVVDPAVRWAVHHDGGLDPHSTAPHEPGTPKEELAHAQVHPDWGWRSKLVTGLECPHCIGFWIGAATLATGALAEKHPAALAVFNAVAGSLGLSYVTGHVSQRLDS